MLGYCANMLLLVPLTVCLKMQMHANPPASGGIALYQRPSSLTQPTCESRNVLLMDVVSTNRLNIIQNRKGA